MNDLHKTQRLPIPETISDIHDHEPSKVGRPSWHSRKQTERVCKTVHCYPVMSSSGLAKLVKFLEGNRK